MSANRRLLVLDDDPTGSQCVAHVDAAFDPDPAIPSSVLSEPGATCFVLTNTRAMGQIQACAVNRRIVSGVLERDAIGTGLHIVSRSDSTLRGHVIAEPAAIADELDAHGLPVDGILFCPAMLEAGRFTRDDVHYAVVDGEPVPVGETAFAQDATFGYNRSELPEFLDERSNGEVSASNVLSISLDDIRLGGRSRVVEILARARARQWIVVNAMEYSDMDTVASALQELEQAGRTFISRCGPSFVRALAGQSGPELVAAENIEIPVGRLDHGLVVVGSHVGLTTRQLAAVHERGELTEIQLDVPVLLDERRDAHIAQAAAAIVDTLHRNDCVVYTSRDLIRSDDPEESLAIARSISDAVVDVVRAVREARPAWIVAKGGITSHEVAASGLDVRRAEVVGQFWPGQVSLFIPHDAPEEVAGMPYVVFPGNVGGEQALADVIDRLTVATRGST